jgi:hypothetical protein
MPSYTYHKSEEGDTKKRVTKEGMIVSDNSQTFWH